MVLYRCDLPICVRLDHLEAGSQRTDHADKRGPAGQSYAVRDVVRHALTTGVTDPHQLAAIIDAVIASGGDDPAIMT